jgi:hypothetical protein
MKTKAIIVIFLACILITACGPKFIPITTSIPLDSNKDGMITPAELQASFVVMHTIIKRIAEYKPAEAAKLDAEVTTYENTDANLLNIDTVFQTGSDILTLATSINVTQTAK